MAMAYSSAPAVKMGPAAHLLLLRNGLDAAQVQATGPNGWLLKGDVLAHLEGRSKGGVPRPPKRSAPQKSSSAPAQATPSPDQSSGVKSTAGAAYTEESVGQVRKVIAKRLTQSKQQVPHYYVSVDCRLDQVAALRAALAQRELKVSVNDILVQALAKAASQCSLPRLLGSSSNEVDVAVAVASERGLITPIVKAADQKGLIGISEDIKKLAAKAKAGTLQPHEFQGGTVTISNLGMFAIDHFTSIINTPQQVILAVGKGERKPVVNTAADGTQSIGVGTVMTATFSFDRGVFSEEDAGKVAQAFRQLVEAPAKGLVG